MTVTVFENATAKPLVVILEPNEERYELPSLARIGVRYSFSDEETDRTFASVGEHDIRFWCDSKEREVEIVHPTPFDLLLNHICAKLGFCGGLVSDVPTHVTDLLPASGQITAEEFAGLAISAECDQQSPTEKHLRWVALLSEAFIEHMGASSVSADRLKRNLAQPFDLPEG